MTDTHDPGDRGKDGKRYRLTLKQEAFCRAYVETGNASEAYRTAYPTSLTWTDAGVWSQASQLLRNSKVVVWLETARAKMAEHMETTVESLTLALRKAGKLAHDEGQAGAAAQAVMGEAKLHGHLVDKHEDVTPVDDMPEAELAEHMAELDRKLIAAMSDADLEAHEVYLQGQLAEVRAKLARPPLKLVDG